MELCAHIRKLSHKPTTLQKLDLANKCRKLRNRITTFSNTAVQYLREDTHDIIYEVDQIIVDDEVSTREINEQDDNTISVTDPKRQVLPFPSVIPTSLRPSHGSPNSYSGTPTHRISDMWRPCRWWARLRVEGTDSSVLGIQKHNPNGLIGR